MVGVDQFSATGTNSSGAFSFTDNFSDGDPPPCGPAGCATQPTFYGVLSTTALPAESGSLLQLDFSNGISTTNALDGARLNQAVTLGGTKSELSLSSPLTTVATFTLPGLSGPYNNGYGIRLVDAAPGSPPGSLQQALELNVEFWTGNMTHPAGLYVRYLMQDFTAGTITTIGVAPLIIPPGTNDIMLTLASVSNGLFEATYQYGTDGVFGAFGGPFSLGTSAALLYGQTYLRPQIHAFETVTQLPGTLPLFASGLGALGLLAWRRKRKNVAAGAAA